jgi:hypothetical protein
MLQSILSPPFLRRGVIRQLTDDGVVKFTSYKTTLGNKAPFRRLGALVLPFSSEFLFLFPIWMN